MDAAGTHTALTAVHASLSAISEWDGREAQLEAALRTLCEQFALKPGQLFGAVRVAISNRTVAPPLFETLTAFGRTRSLDRIAAAISVVA
jgi:glutamyl-tRNA synthetase